MSDEHGQPNGKFKCIKDGIVLNPESYSKHIKTKTHLGIKLEKYKCPKCSKSCVSKFSTQARLIINIIVIRYARRDSYKRHCDVSKCGKSMAGLPPPSFLADPAAASSNLVPPVVVPTVAFTHYHPYVMSVPQHAQTAPPAAGAPQHGRMPTFAAPGPTLFQPANDAVPEPAEDDEDDDDAEFWQNNEIRDADED
jgi:hypothetical protein